MTWKRLSKYAIQHPNGTRIARYNTGEHTRYQVWLRRDGKYMPGGLYRTADEAKAAAEGKEAA